VSCGYTKGIEYNYTGWFKNSLYFAFQSGGDFFDPGFNWSTNFSYWEQNIEPVMTSSFIDGHIPDSRSSYIIGGRLSIDLAKTLPHWILPIVLFSGISHHFISYKYNSENIPAGYNLKIKNDLNSFDFGFNSYIKISGHFRIFGQMECFSFFNDLNQGGTAYMIGLTYLLRKE
jgi:hypothetical protein